MSGYSMIEIRGAEGAGKLRKLTIDKCGAFSQITISLSAVRAVASSAS
jgi:hypothetical protein